MKGDFGTSNEIAGRRQGTIYYKQVIRHQSTLASNSCNDCTRQYRRTVIRERNLKFPKRLIDATDALRVNEAACMHVLR